jgi:hypothetical protein
MFHIAGGKWNRFSAKIGKIRTLKLLVSSQVLYHYATAAVCKCNRLFLKILITWKPLKRYFLKMKS